jgi:hypothetical protein
MKTKTHFDFRVDIWDDAGDSIVEHVAGVDDFEVAEATYRAAVARWLRAAHHAAAGLSKCRDLPAQIKSELRNKERLVDKALLAELFAGLARAADCRGSHPAHVRFARKRTRLGDL